MGSLLDYYASQHESSTGETSAPTTNDNSRTPTANISPVAQGVVSQAANYGLSQSPVASIPGVGGVLSGAVNTGIYGGSPAQVGQSAVSGGISSLLQHALPGLPALPSMIGAASASMLSPNPQPAVAATKAGISSLGAILGSPLGPIGSVVGSAIASSLGDQSIAEGYLGDALDARSREKERDSVEKDLGQSVSSTKGMAATDTLGMAEREDGYGFGLSANYGATKQGVMDKAVGPDPFGVQAQSKSLAAFYSERLSSMDVAPVGATESTSDISTKSSRESVYDQASLEAGLLGVEAIATDPNVTSISEERSGGDNDNDATESGGMEGHGGGDGNDNDSGAGGGTGSDGSDNDTDGHGE